MLQMLVPNQIERYRRWHTLEARRVCHSLLARPAEFVSLFKVVAMNAASWAAYGHPGDEEKMAKVTQIAVDEVYHMSPGSHLVE